METSTSVTTTPETITTAADMLQEQVERASGFFTGAARYFRNAVPVILLALVILAAGILVSRLIAKMFARTLRRSRLDKAAAGFLVSVVRILLYIIVLIMALSVLKVPMSSIITIFGAAGLAVSLALQNCLSNLCGGFIILFSKPFSAGDTIELDGTVGKVQAISILYTKMLTFDSKTVYIPNGKVSDAKIINYTASPTRRVELTFNIAYSADFNKACELIKGVIAENKAILNDPAPIVRMSGHKDSSVAVDVFVWVNNDDYINTRYDLFEDVKRVFDENNIVIPFSQLDVHIVGNNGGTIG